VYRVRYTDGQKKPGNSCPRSYSREFCRGWDDASSAKIRTATSISSSNPACVQLGGDIRNALDQQHFCIGQSDGKNQADDLKNHIGRQQLRIRQSKIVRGIKSGMMMS